jgi:acyl-CoA synthetase (NDP forming)
VNLKRLLEPAAVALVGASADPKKISGMMVEFLRRSSYTGRVYAINPRYDRIGDWQCHSSVDALPEVPDVVVVAVPVAFAFEAIEQAARRGVPFVVLMTGGFGEGTSGEEGERRRERLAALCAETGMRVVGPNTVGMVNFRFGMPLTFADWYGRDTGQRGGVAILTHSGSVGGLIFSSLQINRVGVDYWIAAGNEANLEVADFIDWFSADDRLHTIACFMEGVVDGRKFMQAVAKARRAGKNVVVLKAGASEASLRSTAAHTVKRSTAPDVYRGVFAQLGVVQVGSLAELTYAVTLLEAQHRGTRGTVGILSASGGACSVIADHVVDAGLELPELDANVQQRLAQSIPEYGSTRNPVDLSADVVSRRDIIDGTFATLAAETLVDTWLVFGRPVIDRYHAEICGFARDTGKSVIVSSGVALRPEVQDALHAGHVAVLDDPAICMRALGAVHAAGRAGAHDGDWAAMPRRKTGNASRNDGVGRRLASAGFPTTAGTAASGASSRAALSISARHDADFGPVLAFARVPERARRDAGRIVRALPVSDATLAAAIAEVDAITDGAIAGQQDALARIARTVCDAYAAETTVAEIVVALALDAAGVRVIGIDVHGVATT